MKKRMPIVLFFILISCAGYGDRDVASTKEFAHLRQDKVANISVPTIDKNTKAEANTSKSKTENKLLNFVRGKYKKNGFVQISISKELRLKALEKTKADQGKLYLANKGRFRLELNGPPKSIAILNSKKGWLVDYPDPDFGGKLQVLVSKSSKLQKSQDMIRLIMGEGDLKKYFFQKSKKLEGKNAIYFFKAATKDFDFTDLEIHINIVKKEISSIVYFDQLENKTSYIFEKTNFDASIDDSLFDYQIPKDAEVTVIN